ncbi:diaminopimelate epimerase [Thioalkalivibrio sp. XN8]|uniref:diaminopimelate epimerase n=1 Tax=Thioalkalivibrio sp. XN8 TaxID=2712863 RepID=UPI0013EDBCED|nr:diaminopimelate epimerase [Thioalkalivibrio sp. XN8]NGP52869.1 diaminopimelate epimerase [Thioalkalivibrio sp. XN8]
MSQTAASAAPPRLHFHKMAGAGNDFVVVDARGAPFVPDAALARRLADRREGIGCDQLLVIGPAPDADTAFSYRIWNADGGEVEQCGNGARCLALLWGTELAPGSTSFRMHSAGGQVEACVRGGEAAVAMGVPDFAPAAIPLAARAEAPRYVLRAAGRQVEVGAVSMGNPHAVLVLDELGLGPAATAPVAELGPALETHPDFPRRVNVGFAELRDRGHVSLRVWERGCGETQACGTGACAAVAVLRDAGRVDSRVSVDLPGGRLVVEWQGRGQPVWLSGPSRKVFEGSIEL